MKRDFATVAVGILFLAAGVLLGGSMLGYFDFDYNLAGWWTLFIIIPALLSMTQVGPNTGNIILLGVGTLLLLDQQRILPRHIGLKLIFPVVLLAVGFQILFGGNAYRRSRREGNGGGEGSNPSEGGTGASAGAGGRSQNGRHSGGGIFSSVSSPGEGHKKASVTFGGEEIHYADEDFLGGSYTAVFGGLTVNLVGARLSGDVVINVSAIFGGIEIILPRGVRVVMNVSPILGGSECKYPASSDPSAPTVIVNGTVTFGGVEVK